MHLNPSQGLNGPEALNGLAGSPSSGGPEPTSVTWTPPQPMAGAPLTGYDVLSSTPGGGDEEAFQGRW
jgi:hypothetical protein